MCSQRSGAWWCAWRSENPTWGYTRIVGALKNVGHRVSRSTIARILKADGIPPVPERPTSWRTFLQAHWGAIAGADFFTTEVWTWRGLVTYYTVFVIDLWVGVSQCHPLIIDFNVGMVIGSAWGARRVKKSIALGIPRM